MNTILLPWPAPVPPNVFPAVQGNVRVVTPSPISAGVQSDTLDDASHAANSFTRVEARPDIIQRIDVLIV